MGSQLRFLMEQLADQGQHLLRFGLERLAGPLALQERVCLLDLPPQVVRTLVKRLHVRLCRHGPVSRRSPLVQASARKVFVGFAVFIQEHQKTHEHFNNGQTARLRSREAGAVEGGLGGGERTGRPTGDRHG